jgi:hypothetical protein
MPQHLCGLCKSSVHEHRTSPFKMLRNRLSCKAYLARLEQARLSVVHEPINIPDIKSGALISPALDWFDAMVFVIGMANSSMLAARERSFLAGRDAFPPAAGER